MVAPDHSFYTQRIHGYHTALEQIHGYHTTLEHSLDLPSHLALRSWSSKNRQTTTSSSFEWVWFGWKLKPIFIQKNSMFEIFPLYGNWGHGNTSPSSSCKRPFELYVSPSGKYCKCPYYLRTIAWLIRKAWLHTTFRDYVVSCLKTFSDSWGWGLGHLTMLRWGQQGAMNLGAGPPWTTYWWRSCLWRKFAICLN